MFGEREIRIDYENIDVADIMDQIKKRIARRPKRPQTERQKEEFLEAPSPLASEWEASGTKARIKRLVLKVTRPFSPLIKLLIFPVYTQFRETVLILDRTNRRVDHLNDNIDDLYRRLERTMEYTKLLHSLSHNIVVELSKLKIEEENLKMKTRIMEKDFEFLGKREKVLEKHLLK